MSLISVIVPVYNAEKHLRACVESITRQTHKELEVILVDDGAKDASGKICDELAMEDPRIRVIHKQNGGVSAARNTGLDAATGEFIAFVDSDDYILDTMLEKLLLAIKDKDIAFCRFVTDNGQRIERYHEDNLRPLTEAPYDFRYIMVDTYGKATESGYVGDKVFGSVWRTLFRADRIREAGLGFVPGVKIAEDRLFLLEYCSHCTSAGLVDEYLYAYRVGLSEQATSAFHKYQPDLEKTQKVLAEKQRELIEKNTQLSKGERKKLKGYITAKTCYTVVMNEIWHNTDGCVSRLKSIFKDPFYKRGVKLSGLLSARSELGISPRTLVLYALIKFRLWSVLKNRLGSKVRGANGNG